MSVNYTYSVSGDTSNGINSAKLTYEIQASAIVTALDYININGDVCDIYFKATLSSEEIGRAHV